MKSSIYTRMGKIDSALKIGLFRFLTFLFLLITSSAYSQSTDSDNESRVTRNILEAQLLDVSTYKFEHGNFDPALIGKLIDLADSQSLIGEYENAIESLKEALQVSRINHGLYDYSQVEILDELIINEALMKNWEAVNTLYGLEEHLFRRLFEPTDARLEAGLRKVTAWHISAINEDIDSNKQEHLLKLQELLAIRLEVIENLHGDDNAIYEVILTNLANTKIELAHIRRNRNFGVGSPAPSYTPTSIE